MTRWFEAGSLRSSSPVSERDRTYSRMTGAAPISRAFASWIRSSPILPNTDAMVFASASMIWRGLKSSYFHGPDMGPSPSSESAIFCASPSPPDARSGNVGVQGRRGRHECGILELPSNPYCPAVEHGDRFVICPDDAGGIALVVRPRSRRRLLQAHLLVSWPLESKVSGNEYTTRPFIDCPKVRCYTRPATLHHRKAPHVRHRSCLPARDRNTLDDR